MIDRRRTMSGGVPEPVRAPLLDRLINPAAPAGRADGGRVAASVRAMRDAIQRDLESLLNTRWRCRSWPPQLEELDQSIVNYGIPDFTGASFDNPVSQRDFRQIITRAINRFEPRLKNVKVSVTAGPPTSSTDTRTLRFRIEAMILSEDGRQSVAYETQMNPTDSTFTVRRAGR